MLRRRLVKNFGPAFGHVPAVLEPDAELAGNVDPRLVGEAHAGRERRHVAMDQIGGLVPVHADAVAGAVRKARQLVAGPVAPAFVGGAHRVVDAAGRQPELRRADRDLLASWTWFQTLRCSGVGRRRRRRCARCPTGSRGPCSRSPTGSCFPRLRSAAFSSRAAGPRPRRSAPARTRGCRRARSVAASIAAPKSAGVMPPARARRRGASPAA